MPFGIALSISALLHTAAAHATAPLRWVKPPELTFDEKAGQWLVRFELNALTDVEVAIVDPAKSKVVRHLAAGVLGPKAPPPLQLNSCAQKITWDGMDDYGTRVSRPESLAVRVRAGMSVALEQMVGGDPYAYYSEEMGNNDHSPFGINGLELKPDGKVYVLGHSSNLGPPALRQYDIDGNYLRTVFPPPAGKPLAAMKGWGINVRPDGTYTPKFTRLTDPSLTTTILDTGTGGMARLFPAPGQNRLTLWNTDSATATLQRLIIHTDGTIPEDPVERSPGPLVTDPPLSLGPVAPGSHVHNSLLGPVFTCFTADRKHFYLSGAYAATTRYGSVLEIKKDGFWRDGQVWKVDAENGKASVFFALDANTIPSTAKDRAEALGGGKSFAALHGIAVDEQENVFVCDRLNRRVLVLDRSGKLLRQIPVEHPDAIALSARTGALYVTTRIGRWGSPGQVTLLKFNDWRKDDTPAVTERVSATGYAGTYTCSHLVVCDTRDASNVWVAYTEMPVRIYRDDDKGFRLLRDFYQVEGAQRCLGFDRIEADPSTEEVYVLDDHFSVWKVSDWQRPRFVRVPLRTASVAIDPRHRHIFADLGGGHSKKGIARFHLDEQYSPANIGTTGSNELTPVIFSEWCFTGNGDLGFAVASNGNLAALDQRGGLLFFQGSATKVPWNPMTLVHTGPRAGGVRFDRTGNLYVGYVDTAPTRKLPGFEGDRFFSNIGRIYKYSPTGSLASGNLFPTRPTGPSRIYDVLYGAFDVDCIVRSPRFDVDGFGRIYYPTNIAQTISIIDNEGNDILQFGTYGNRDSMGGLAGDLVPTRDIPMGFPNSVAVTDNYIYVGDMVNLRLLRIKKEFGAAATSSPPPGRMR